jgi:hypothetical protein
MEAGALYMYTLFTSNHASVKKSIAPFKCRGGVRPLSKLQECAIRIFVDCLLEASTLLRLGDQGRISLLRSCIRPDYSEIAIALLPLLNLEGPNECPYEDAESACLKFHSSQVKQ